MARSFDLTAQLNLVGPSNANITAVLTDIRKRLSNVRTTVNLKISPTAGRNLGALEAALQGVNSTLSRTVILTSLASKGFKDLAADIGLVTKQARDIKTIRRAINSLTGVTTKSTAIGIKEASNYMRDFGEQSALAIRRFAAFSTVSAIFLGIGVAIKSGISDAIKFDKEMIKLSQVSNKSTVALKSLKDEVGRLSVDLGVSSEELLSAASTLAQAGFSIADTKAGLEAIALSDLAPSFESISQTVEGLIATTTQFNIKASDFKDVLGSINEVSARFAVESKDIISAIRITGSLFSESAKGVSTNKEALNEFIAIFASVRATTRESAESIATGLKTIFTRIQRPETIDLLREFNIELLDAERNFIGPYRAAIALSDGLNKIERRSPDFFRILESLGGYRQINKALPLIFSGDLRDQALKAANEGKDSLTSDAVIAQQALAKQFDKTREAFLKLIRDITDTKSFRELIKMSLDLANAFIKIADSLKGIIPYLGIIAGIKFAKGAYQFAGGFLSTIKNPGRRFASGGGVPGIGTQDTVPAMLTPGEFVIRRKAAQKIGYSNLKKLNMADKQNFANGGVVRYFATGAGGVGKKATLPGASVLDNTIGINYLNKTLNSLGKKLTQTGLDNFIAGLTQLGVATRNIDKGLILVSRNMKKGTNAIYSIVDAASEVVRLQAGNAPGYVNTTKYGPPKPGIGTRFRDKISNSLSNTKQNFFSPTMFGQALNGGPVGGGLGNNKGRFGKGGLRGLLRNIKAFGLKNNISPTTAALGASIGGSYLAEQFIGRKTAQDSAKTSSIQGALNFGGIGAVAGNAAGGPIGALIGGIGGAIYGGITQYFQELQSRELQDALKELEKSSVAASNGLDEIAKTGEVSKTTFDNSFNSLSGNNTISKILAGKNISGGGEFLSGLGGAQSKYIGGFAAGSAASLGGYGTLVGGPIGGFAGGVLGGLIGGVTGSIVSAFKNKEIVDDGVRGQVSNRKQSLKEAGEEIGAAFEVQGKLASEILAKRLEKQSYILDKVDPNDTAGETGAIARAQNDFLYGGLLKGDEKNNRAFLTATAVSGGGNAEVAAAAAQSIAELNEALKQNQISSQDYDIALRNLAANSVAQIAKIANARALGSKIASEFTLKLELLAQAMGKIAALSDSLAITFQDNVEKAFSNIDFLNGSGFGLNNKIRNPLEGSDFITNTADDIKNAFGDFRGILQNFGAGKFQQGDIFDRVEQGSLGAKKIQEELPKILAEGQLIPSGQKDISTASYLQEKINKLFEGGDVAIRDELQASVAKLLDRQGDSDTELADLNTRVGELLTNAVSKNADLAREAGSQLFKNLNDVFGEYQSKLKTILDKELDLANSRVAIEETRIQKEDKLAELQGRVTGFREAAGQQSNIVGAILGEGLGAFRNAAPETIGNAIQERKNAIAGRGALTKENLEKNFAANNEINKLVAALKAQGDIQRELAAIEKEQLQIDKKRDEGRDLTEKLLTAGPEELAKLAVDFKNAAFVRNGGNILDLPAQQRKGAIDALNANPFLNDEQKEQQRADLFKNFFANNPDVLKGLDPKFKENLGLAGIAKGKGEAELDIQRRAGGLFDRQIAAQEQLQKLQKDELVIALDSLKVELTKFTTQLVTVGQGIKPIQAEQPKVPPKQNGGNVPPKPNQAEPPKPPAKQAGPGNLPPEQAANMNFDKFNNAVQQLAGIKLPEKILLEGKHVVEVIFNGAEVLNNLMEGPLANLVKKQIDVAFDKRINPLDGGTKEFV